MHKVFIIISLFFGLTAGANTYMGGHMTHHTLGGSWTIPYAEFTLTLYHHQDTIVSLDSAEIYFGDGTSEFVQLGSMDTLCNDVVERVYTTSHYFVGLGSYTIAYTDSSAIRQEAVNVGASSTFPFAVITEVIFSTWLPEAPNSVLFSGFMPVRTAVNTEMRYNPGAINVFDADSLDFALIQFESSPAYEIPSGMTINPLSGEIRWTPDTVGTYEIMVEVKEFYGGPLGGGAVISSSIYNFLITVDSVVNNGAYTDTSGWPVNGQGYYEYWIGAGQNLSLDFDYTDLTADSVGVVAESELFGIGNPAMYNSSVGGTTTNVSFAWTPLAADARDWPYILTFQGRSSIDTTCIHSYITVLVYVDSALGIEEEFDGELLLDVWPNPSNGIFMIDLNTVEQNDWTLKITDATGRIVVSQAGLVGLMTTEVDLSDEPNGVYFVSLIADNHIYRTGIVKY